MAPQQRAWAQPGTRGSLCLQSFPAAGPETEQPWTSRLADVSPARVAAANPLLPVLGAVCWPMSLRVQSAPQTPRMADALQQVAIHTIPMRHVYRYAECGRWVYLLPLQAQTIQTSRLHAVGQPCTWSIT